MQFALGQKTFKFGGNIFIMYKNIMAALRIFLFRFDVGKVDKYIVGTGKVKLWIKNIYIYICICVILYETDYISL